MNEEMKTEFDMAIATARHALEQFNAEPLVESKRGGPRLSPWWRVWRDAEEVAQRWQRQLGRQVDEPSIDDELDRILGKPEGSKVFFNTREPLVSSDTDGQVDVYARSAAGLQRVSSDMNSYDKSFEFTSDDGSQVVYHATYIYCCSQFVFLNSSGTAASNLESRTSTI